MKRQKVFDEKLLSAFARNYNNPRIEHYSFLPPELTNIIAGYDCHMLTFHHLSVRQHTRLEEYEYCREGKDGDNCQQQNMTIHFYVGNDVAVSCLQSMWFYANVDSPTNYEHFFGFCSADQNYRQILNIAITWTFDTDIKMEIFHFIHAACVAFSENDPFNVPHLWQDDDVHKLTLYQRHVPTFEILE